MQAGQAHNPNDPRWRLRPAPCFPHFLSHPKVSVYYGCRGPKNENKAGGLASNDTEASQTMEFNFHDAWYSRYFSSPLLPAVDSKLNLHVRAVSRADRLPGSQTVAWHPARLIVVQFSSREARSEAVKTMRSLAFALVNHRLPQGTNIARRVCRRCGRLRGPGVENTRDPRFRLIVSNYVSANLVCIARNARVAYNCSSQ